jgi:hypothetical protein
VQPQPVIRYEKILAKQKMCTQKSSSAILCAFDGAKSRGKMAQQATDEIGLEYVIRCLVEPTLSGGKPTNLIVPSTYIASEEHGLMVSLCDSETPKLAEISFSAFSQKLEENFLNFLR